MGDATAAAPALDAIGLAQPRPMSRIRYRREGARTSPVLLR